MIPARLIRSLRSQDWVALSLEFVIVVLGIFVGLQADDWNNRRVAANSEAEYLHRLSKEVDQNLEVYGEMIDWLGRSEAGLNAYYGSLNGGAGDRPTEDALLAMLCHPGIIFPASYDNSILEEMLGSGQLARLQNPALRAALAQYRSRQKQWDQRLSDSSENFKSIFEFIDQFREWRPATDEEGFGNCKIDFEALESHERAAHMVANYQRHYHWQRANNLEISGLLVRIQGLLPPAP